MIGGIKSWLDPLLNVRRRPNVKWMTQADDRILETLVESGMVLSPKVIAYNAGYQREYVSQRLAKLLDAGLVNKPERGMYELTSVGRAYVAGELDAGDLES